MARDDASWTLQYLPLSSLRLDQQNPRLPEKHQLEDLTQDELAALIDKHYDALQIARSIARHGYFQSEPLIAIANDDGHSYTVVEGNRRLTALRALSSSEFRDRLSQQTAAWKSLPLEIALPETIPVVIVRDRQSIVPLIGFRHISGIEPWEPWAQARFIARLVDEGNSLEEISELVGRSLTEVRSMYRDHAVLQQASDQFNLDTSRAEESFGVFTAAMGRTKIRDYIRAPSPREVDPELWPLPDDSAEHLERLLTYVFGDEDGEGRVLQDSRQLQALGEVLSDPTGVAETVMVETKSINEALQSMQARGQQFQSFVRSAERALNSAKELDVLTMDGSVRDRLIVMKEIIEELLAIPTSDTSGAA